MSALYVKNAHEAESDRAFALPPLEFCCVAKGTKMPITQNTAKIAENSRNLHAPSTPPVNPSFDHILAPACDHFHAEIQQNSSGRRTSCCLLFPRRSKKKAPVGRAEVLHSATADGRLSDWAESCGCHVESSVRNLFLDYRESSCILKLNF